LFVTSYLILELISTTVEAGCCQTKEVKGQGGKSGFYSLVKESDDVPEFCIGGCVYTKEDDEKEGVYYCFKTGDMDTTCSQSSGECSQVEGWIEKYFEKECKSSINTVLDVGVQKDLLHECKSNACNIPIVNTTVKLFKGRRDCIGEPVMVRYSQDPVGTCKPSTAEFYLSINDQDSWSIAVEKEGFISRCVMLIKPKVFTTNAVEIEMDHVELMKFPTLFLNVEFDATALLLPDLKVISTPMSNCRNGTVEPGSEQWCNPSCGAVSWVVEEPDFNCDCRGLLGGGMNFTEMSYPDEDNEFGKASMKGRIFWYNEEEEPKDLNKNKAFIVYGFFNQRDSTESVCQSNLTFNINYPENSTGGIMKSVPCIPPQTNDSPLNKPNNSTEDEYMAMFNTVGEYLVFGSGDRFWLAGCMLDANLDNFMSFPNFFSSVDPKYTTPLCGCLFSMFGIGDQMNLPESKEFTVDQVKACYVEALISGPGDHTHGIELDEEPGEHGDEEEEDH